MRALGLVTSPGKGKPKRPGFRQVAGQCQGPLLTDGNRGECSEVRGGGPYYFPKVETLRLLRRGHPSYRPEEPLTLHPLLDRSCNQGIGDPISPEPGGPSAVCPVYPVSTSTSQFWFRASMCIPASSCQPSGWRVLSHDLLGSRIQRGQVTTLRPPADPCRG